MLLIQNSLLKDCIHLRGHPLQGALLLASESSHPEKSHEMNVAGKCVSVQNVLGNFEAFSLMLVLTLPVEWKIAIFGWIEKRKHSPLPTHLSFGQSLSFCQSLSVNRFCFNPIFDNHIKCQSLSFDKDNV